MSIYRVLGHFKKDFDFKKTMGYAFTFIDSITCVRFGGMLDDETTKQIEKKGYAVLKMYDKKNYYDFAIDIGFTGKKDDNYKEIFDKIVKQISREDKLNDLKV